MKKVGAGKFEIAFVVGVALVGAVGTVGAGCARVAPYERSRLAHPTMTEGDPAGPGEQHLRAVNEGATGGNLDSTGGCGCN